MPEGTDTSPDDRAFDAGETLFREGDRGDVMYVIRQGAVLLTKVIDGEATTLAELKAGDFVGELGLVRNATHTATATASEATRCLAIDAHTLERMVTADGEIAVRFIKALADRLATSYELMSLIGQRDPRTRVCMAIIRHAEMSSEETGEGIWIRKRLGDIAEEVAVSDTEMGEISKQLMRLQLLRIKRDGILVPDVSRLYEFVKSSDA